MKKFGLFILIILGLVMGFFWYGKNKEAKVLFVGDMFFDRQIRKTIYSKGEDHLFSCISDFLKSADMVVGNLEGPITENASKSMLTEPGSPDNFIFTFPTVSAKLLAKNNIKIVNLGNNHIGNFGKEGIESTKKFLDEAGVKYFGGLTGNEPIYRTEIAGKKVSFVSYNEFGGDSSQKVSEKIKKEVEDGQTVIVYTHWGEEYIAPATRIKNAAKLFAQSGAKAIVGSHPHVILEKETIKLPSGQETVVYYSLGNFIFDQYWNKEVSTGLVLEFNFKGDQLSIREHRVSINRDGTTCLN